MKFNSRKDIAFLLMAYGFVGVFLGIILYRLFSDEFSSYENFWVEILMALVVALIVWISFGTEYELTQSELKYKSGPIRGKIEVSQIKEIIKGKSLYSGLKPATARHGLVIKYEKFEEIYISPKSNDTFIKRILELNPNIKITFQSKAACGNSIVTALRD